MAYVAAPPPAPVLPPVTFVQSSAKYWQDLQKHVASGGREGNRGQKMTVRMGNGGVVLLPVFNRAHFMGQDEGDDLSNLFGVESASDQGSVLGTDWTGGSSVSAPSGLTYGDLLTGNVLMPSSATGAETEYSQPSEIASEASLAASTGAYSPYNLPASAYAGSSTASSAQQALNAAIAAGASATQIAALQAQLKTAQAPVAAVSSGIIPGVSNTLLFLGSAIVLIILASGKKR